MAKKIRGSWETPRGGNSPYSPEGIASLKQNVRNGLMRKYAGLAECMFEYDLPDDNCREMVEMSWRTVPEVPLFDNGKLCIFEDPETKDLHMLPFVLDTDGLNIYGRPVSWHPVPVGWTAASDARFRASDAFSRYMDLHLTLENSVIIKNDNTGSSDRAFIETLIDNLIENVLTMGQLQLLARMPFVFDVSEDNVLSAKQMFLNIASGQPVIFTNKYGEDITPKIAQTGTGIDPSLFEIFDRFECLILEQLGYPCVPITKRAQQSVAEVQSSEDKVSCRRKEKFMQRKMAVDRMNELFGTHASVISVIDSQEDNKEMSGEEQEAEDDTI